MSRLDKYYAEVNAPIYNYSLWGRSRIQNVSSLIADYHVKTSCSINIMATFFTFHNGFPYSIFHKRNQDPLTG